jgi:hypothetical protein
VQELPVVPAHAQHAKMQVHTGYVLAAPCDIVALSALMLQSDSELVTSTVGWCVLPVFSLRVTGALKNKFVSQTASSHMPLPLFFTVLQARLSCNQSVLAKNRTPRTPCVASIMLITLTVDGWCVAASSFPSCHRRQPAWQGCPLCQLCLLIGLAMSACQRPLLCCVLCCFCSCCVALLLLHLFFAGFLQVLAPYTSIQGAGLGESGWGELQPSPQFCALERGSDIFVFVCGAAGNDLREYGEREYHPCCLLLLQPYCECTVLGGLRPRT